MENEQKETTHGTKNMACTSEKCAGGGCGCGHHHMYILKWLLKIVILIVVFCFAFKMGEIKGALEGRGYYGMSGSSRGTMMHRGAYGQGDGMMMNQPSGSRSTTNGSTVSPAVPATPSVTQ